MPVYEYRCGNCDTPYTFVRGISESEPQYQCNTCNFNLTRVYSNVGVTFNGDGFYKTDNRKV